MSDPLRTDAAQQADATSDADRDAKIEQLLLAGLDHYFAAQHEQAINVWTRALFFDRNHPKARAYIERARSAMAERLRQSEELLQTGVAAFHRGDTLEARRLVQAAIDGGAPGDDALALLGRIDRLDQVPAVRQRERRVDRAPRVEPQPDARRPSRTAVALSAMLAALIAAVAAALYLNPGAETLPVRGLTRLSRTPLSVAPITRETGLPLPRRGEMALARARSLNASGHLHDALTELDAVRATDPQKAEADRLRIEIQQHLLTVMQSSAGGYQ